MNKVNRVKKLADEYALGMALQMKERQTSLKKLVVEHGIEAVAIASGLTEESLKTYIRSKYPVIGLQTVVQAKEILAKL